MKRLTLVSKLLIIMVVVGGAFIALKFMGDKGIIDTVAPAEKSNKEIDKSAFDFANKSNAPAPAVPRAQDDDVIRIAVVTWGGYAGGQYFNGGFKPNAQSRYLKEYGLNVEFVVIDDWNTSREAWKSDNVNLLWSTVDAFTTEAADLMAFKPKILFQADWSRGGDSIVVRRGINSVNDLVGKKIAIAFGTPSHTFLLWMLKAADIKYSDIQVVQAPSAIDAASYFKASQVDAAVVWSPDDEDCVGSVSGARILKSTKEASHIIADVFYAKEDYINANRAKLVKLMEGWFKGAAEVNSSQAARADAARILATGLGQPEEFMVKAINNVRLATYGDNAGFFGLDRKYTGVMGEEIYNAMNVAYGAINLAGKAPNWRLVTDTSLLAGINLTGPGHEAEGAAKFAPATEADLAAPAFSTKRVTISYATGSAVLDENAKYIISKELGEIAKAFANSRIRIEGNTDNVGSKAGNVALSKKRAEAVSSFLVSEYGFDPNRFIVIGNGDSKPVADNSTPDGRAKNRRTDFEIVN